MFNSVSAQTSELLLSAGFGVLLGVLFDVVKIAKYKTSKKALITVVFDILFWVTAIILFLAFVLLKLNGAMRWYILLGVFCGAFVYKASVSEMVFKIILSLCTLVFKVLGLITRPFYLFFRFLWRCFKKAISGIENFLKKSHIKKKGSEHNDRVQQNFNTAKKEKEKGNCV